MTESTTRICARLGCGERFSLVLRAGRDSGRAKAGRKRSLHKGRRYCSDTCRKLASKARAQPSPNGRPIVRKSDVFSTVTTAENSVDILPTYKGQKSGRGSLKRTFGGYTVVPDPEWPEMYRVRRPDGSLTEMVNLTRARDAAREFARVPVQTEAG
jgi:hypothetical protein